MNDNTQIKAQLLFRKKELEEEISEIKSRIFDYEEKVDTCQSSLKAQELKGLILEEKDKLAGPEHYYQIVGEVLSEMFYIEPREEENQNIIRK